MKVWTLKIQRNPMIPNYLMIPAAAIRWSPGIRWSPAIRWSIRSMDFDNRKVYGDTSISDGLVHILYAHFTMPMPEGKMFNLIFAKLSEHSFNKSAHTLPTLCVQWFLTRRKNTFQPLCVLMYVSCLIVICVDQTLISDIRAVTCGGSVSRILSTAIAQYSPTGLSS